MRLGCRAGHAQHAVCSINQWHRGLQRGLTVWLSRARHISLIVLTIVRAVMQRWTHQA